MTAGLMLGISVEQPAGEYSTELFTAAWMSRIENKCS